MPETQKLQLKFNASQATSISNATKYNELSKKYIEALQNKLLSLTSAASKLQEKLKFLEREAAEINAELLASEKEATSHYSRTLKEVLDSMQTPPPPWEAKVIYQDRTPIGVELFLKPSPIPIDNSKHSAKIAKQEPEN